MLKFWYKVEFAKGNCKLSIKQLYKFLKVYILPTVAAVAFFRISNENLLLNFKEMLICLSIINLCYISAIHIFIQKVFLRAYIRTLY